MPDFILDVQGLETTFKTPDGIVHVVNGVTFGLGEGETLGVVGESGCGKSVTMLSVLGLIASPPGQVAAGKAIFAQQDLLKLPKDELRYIRGAQISMIFQDPMTALTPVLPVGLQIGEARQERLRMSGKQAEARVVELLEMVGIPRPEDRLKDYPHQLSGGMRQRVMIAIAIAGRPKLLIADEPTAALDVTVDRKSTRLNSSH